MQNGKTMPISRDPLSYRIPNELLGNMGTSRLAEMAGDIARDAAQRLRAEIDTYCLMAAEKGENWIVGVSPPEISEGDSYVRKFMLIEGRNIPADLVGWSFFEPTDEARRRADRV